MVSIAKLYQQALEMRFGCSSYTNENQMHIVWTCFTGWMTGASCTMQCMVCTNRHNELVIVESVLSVKRQYCTIIQVIETNDQYLKCVLKKPMI